MKKITISILSISLLYSCNNGNDQADAYGNFESAEVIVSSESAGKLEFLNIEEGMELKKGEIIALVDTTQLSLKKEQLQASINAVTRKIQPVESQINVLTEKRRNILREKNRMENLLADSAATQQQYDDITGQLEVVDKEIKATRDRLESANRGILSEIKPLEIQIAQINDQLDRSKITNPIDGTVLQKFAQAGEITVFGKPLYKIASLKTLNLRAYVSGNQLAMIKLGQKVSVQVDDGKGELKDYAGQISWISSRAEFTPKVIQTREERVSLVYAIKIAVQNDGLLKIGMPGEVLFNK